MNKKYQEARQNEEDKALRKLDKECEVAWGWPPDPDHHRYHISPMTEIENPFPPNHQNLSKGDVST